METSFGDREFISGTDNGKLPRMSALQIRECLIVEFPVAIRAVQETSKLIAHDIDTTPRTIEGQRQGQHLPSLPVGLALARKYPHIKKLFLRLMDAETGDSGEDPTRVLNEIQRLAASLTGGTR
jgi:hypothetical protein